MWGKLHLRMRGIVGNVWKVDGIDRQDPLQYKKKKPDMYRVSLVITYMKQLPDIHKIRHVRMDILQKLERMTQVFSDPPLVAYRRDRDLGNFLVQIMDKALINVKTDRRVCTILEKTRGKGIWQDCPHAKLKIGTENCMT